MERLRRAIGEYTIEGVPTTLPLLNALLDETTVRDATYGTATLERFAAAAFAAPSNGRRLHPLPQICRLRPRSALKWTTSCTACALFTGGPAHQPRRDARLLRAQRRHARVPPPLETISARPCMV